MKKNGKSRHGNQRWYCFSCERTYGWTNAAQKRAKERIWFERWLSEGYTLRQLSMQSGHSRSKLRGVIRYWLEHPPQDIDNISNVRNILVDGTYLYRRTGMLCIMDAEEHTMVVGAYGVPETSRGILRIFFATLKERGLSPKSATTDGNPHVTHVLRVVWPDIVLQRCLVHIQRQGLSWCRRNPKRTDARHLRDLFLRVTTIRDPKDRGHLLSDVRSWERRYGRVLDQLPDRGWVMSDLKRARSMLHNALPDMFHYLDDTRTPASTNGLEGYFARLKMRYRQHRGFSKELRPAYFQWYFRLCNR